MPRENIAKYIILGLLSIQPLSGYGIKKWVESSISNFWNISYGQIYPTLRKIEAEGLAVKREFKPDKGPRRNQYTITDRGKQEFINWLQKDEAGEYEILLKIFFGAKLSRDENMEKIQRFREKRVEDRERLEKTMEELQKNLDKNEDNLYFLLITSFGIKSYKSQIKWSDEALKLLNHKNGF
ncbi:PadR family transcriptional regulator [Methanobacterium aggregans]|uniref:PadR family transcriptional regulator n=1 Tax=Methanobacterium aggregans TaxID=1615586 RepID=UPI001AEAF011|nr:PadR family transcriptional regulator [Methanobacterium aggregans]MBP2046833.1 DNA-binding PadR family transcriptional regulator [Methanobacterium aggregans]